VVDVNGATVWENKYPTKSIKQQINLPQTVSGVYTLMVETIAGTAYKKLLILK